MSLVQGEIQFSFNARYFDNGVAEKDTKAIWFVFHGYGQLAFYFLRKFEIAKEFKIRVIAPEGLSRYYLQDDRGRVGATWMTKEDRERDILNYRNYVKSVYDKIIGKYTDIPPITLLGFSQGAATVSRCAQDIGFDRLILWAGLLPHDMKAETGSALFKDKDIHFVYGTKDPFLSDERFTEMERITSMFGIEPQVTSFDGVHDIDGPTLRKFF